MRGALALVDEALWDWGMQARERGHNLVAGVGWPAETALSRFMREGFNGAAQSGGRPPSMTDRAMRVDGAVTKLPERPRKAVRLYYVDFGGNEVLCVRRFGASRPTFYRDLKLARESLSRELLTVR